MTRTGRLASSLDGCAWESGYEQAEVGRPLDRCLASGGGSVRGGEQ